MSKKILIVDDAVFMRTILRGILDRAGYEVVADAGDGKKAVDTYIELTQENNKPDLVLMDITMPEVDGIEDGIAALKEIKKFDSSAKVVMCSSISSQHTVVEAIKEGARHFISKPFDEKKVIETIQGVLGKE